MRIIRRVIQNRFQTPYRTNLVAHYTHREQGSSECLACAKVSGNYLSVERRNELKRTLKAPV
jgi:hypothetical protein